MIKLAIFASGSGSNAEAIIQYFKNHDSIEVALILSNRKNAYVLQRAEEHGIESVVMNKEAVEDKDQILSLLDDHGIDYIILAGFLILIPEYLVEKYPDKILNIHPALLPKYGGKGMYGHHVHKAVHHNKEKRSGMSIHYVNSRYDEGKIIFQASTELLPSDSPEDIAAKVLELEHRHYPRQIERVIQKDQSH